MFILLLLQLLYLNYPPLQFCLFAILNLAVLQRTKRIAVTRVYPHGLCCGLVIIILGQFSICFSR